MADEAAIRELSEKMAKERSRLLSLLEPLSEEAASTPPKPGEWNAKEQMSHLCEMESAYRAWVQRAVAEDNADIEGVRGEPAPIPLEQANEHTVAEHIAAMKRERERTLQLIASLQPEDYERHATNQMFGTLTLLQWLRSYYRHDCMHYDQISGREPAYKPRYLSGREPDQRRGQRHLAS